MSKNDEDFGALTIGAVLEHKRKLQEGKTKQIKAWAGKAPSACDLCGGPITTDFVDGRTDMGPWANMCLDCHENHGTGLGTGFGQRYAVQEDGRWLKTEG